MDKIIILVFSSLFILTKTEMIGVNATIYADNYFEFYVNDALIKKDPLDFTPHNAVSFAFSVNKGEKRVYAIKASDFASESGYEYTKTSSPQLGDGALRIVMSDCTVSNKNWKCFTTSFGPTDESNSAGCDSSHLNLCKINKVEEPTGWRTLNFDDSSWKQATEYSESDAGWGMTPSYSNGLCKTLTDPETRQNKNPDSLATTSDECLAPKSQNWGDSEFIWQPDLKRDNTILCRLVVSGNDDDKCYLNLNNSNQLKFSFLMMIVVFLFFVN